MRNRAFTLIELLTAVAVIAVLASILIPAVVGVRFHAWEVQSASNIRQLALANQTYAAEHGHYAPGMNLHDSIHWHGARVGGTFQGTGGYLSDYLEGGQVRMCPVLENWVEAEPGTAFDEGTGGYGYNGTYIGGRPQMSTQVLQRGSDTQPWWATGNLVTQVPNLSKTVMFTSTAIVRGQGIVETGFTQPYRHLQAGQLGETATATVHFRFKGRAVVAWADAHVSFEVPNDASTDWNVYGDDNGMFSVGWFGPTDWNGYWNPKYEYQVPY
ncbi:type II secretion system protein [Coraliomargarita sp. W4R72]